MTKRTDYNTFWELDKLETIAIPETAVSKLRGAPSAFPVYAALLVRAKLKGFGTVQVKTAELLEETGLSDETLRKVRRELETRELVKFDQKTGNRNAVWECELLNPANGKSLPNRDNVDFTALSNWAVEQFYFRLMPERWDAEQGAYRCPFGLHAKSSFHVHTEPGTDRHGGWQCSQCDKDDEGKKRYLWGGLIKFMASYKKASWAESSRRTRSLLQEIIADEQAGLAATMSRPRISITGLPDANPDGIEP
jgi:hypothetical protein